MRKNSRLSLFLLVFTCFGVFLLLCANRPSLDVSEGRLPSAKPVSVQSPSEGKEECGSEWDRPAGERTTQDRERGMWRIDAGRSPVQFTGWGKVLALPHHH